MESSILNFLLLVLRILLDFSPDASYEGAGFSKTLTEKNLKFVPNKRPGIVIFNLDLILLPTGVDPISKK